MTKATKVTKADRPQKRDPVWLDANAGDFDAFVAGLPTKTDPAQWPNADHVVQNVLIYSGDVVRGARGAVRRALMGEWVRAFQDGPGIIVIKGAFADVAALDRATAQFERFIDVQRQTGQGGGDHFARPGANDRVWNALEKHCLADPEGFALYYGNAGLALVAEAWLGPNYQVTAQVNRVNPGGSAQTAHRDYHLGFMTSAEAARYPAQVHRLSPYLTLQGAVAHCDMPVESGPTMYLPYSQAFPEGYIAFGRPEFQDYFRAHHVQLPLAKGDAVFFNPALMHGAGANRSHDIYRMANLLQVSSAFGRAMESTDRNAMARGLFGPLRALIASGRMTAAQGRAAVAACAEGYAFPTDLDIDPPVGGLAPASQADLMRQALDAGHDAQEFAKAMDARDLRRGLKHLAPD